MAAAQKGLGRGLGALFQDDAQEVREKQGGLMLPIGSIAPNPNQPRKDFDEEALKGLSESIKSQGVLQPILVRPVQDTRPPRYEIVAGERRWRASQLAGLVEVPVLIRELSDQDTLAIALIENLQREDLNPLEEALGIKELKERFGLSQEELSKTLGKSRSAIANILRLLNLSQAAQNALQNGAISSGHARALLTLAEDITGQQALLNKITQDGLTVREAEGWAARRKAGADGAAASGEAALQEAASGDAVAVADDAGEPEGADKKPVAVPAKAKKLPQSAVLLDLQSRLAECINMPVRLIGKEEKGKLSISYSSREELASLLQKIGLGMEL